MERSSAAVSAREQNETQANAPGRTASIGAITLGNALEFYDFTIYSIFAAVIARQFFPAETPLGSLLLSVAVFGVGFLTRPLGGILIGAYADRKGRKAAMTLTISLMALSSAMLAVIPPYAAIGIAAPCLVVLARLIQGFSAGGEMGPATTYLLERAPANQRGFYTSWQSASQGLAFLIAGLMGFIMTQILPKESLESWGWRLPFLLGVLIAPVGIYIRNRLPETLNREQAHRSTKAVLADLFAGHGRTVTLAGLAIAGGAVTMYISSYMTTYALTTLKLPMGVSMLATFVTGATMAVMSLVGGWLSDRFGRKVVMIVPRMLLVLAAYPAFLLITQHQTGTMLLLMVALLVTLHSINAGVMLGMIPESFPSHVRSIGLSFSYAVAVTLFGGTAQFVVTWLIGVTGNPMTPAWYLVIANAVAVVAMMMMRETRHVALND
ncbi:MFS transporter [Brenneria goodwinii]|uniref:MFS transporter n=1 Tax=Brenneria goodwinii TaxID=1109412 RepID=A0AAE8EKY7_9GAMM|nr:MFS transporter [Brenneria goodwinii]RLM17783.1 MFS transporter [Brenneria goodwinii]